MCNLRDPISQKFTSNAQYSNFYFKTTPHYFQCSYLKSKRTFFGNVLYLNPIHKYLDIKSKHNFYEIIYIFKIVKMLRFLRSLPELIDDVNRILYHLNREICENYAVRISIVLEC